MEPFFHDNTNHFQTVNLFELNRILDNFGSIVNTNIRTLVMKQSENNNFHTDVK